MLRSLVGSEMCIRDRSLFVNNADLYDCAARIFAVVETNPQKAFQYREKEYRVTSQVDQWARNQTKFNRLVQALSSMSNDAIAFLEYASAAQQQQAATSTTDASTSSSSTATPVDLLKQMKDAYDAVKTTESHIDATLLASGDYMDAEDGYRKLEVLRKKLNTATRKANKPQ
eukprot:TRINITY_DN13498_c0_g1_i3.p1 TRINITY_DN13498_c0_g1~~TRINITY_DN13498_c0_g1_i3.p1  ORF type:complete len:172 (+),score=67.19 TRINITY_DN13498_c0_g1_i3:105-620(+)